MTKHLATSHPCSPQFRQAPRRVRHVSAYSGGSSPFEGEDVWLAPGAGVLLKLE